MGGKPEVALIMEYVGIPLDQFFSLNKGKFSEKHIIQMLYNILSSLHSIHEAGVMHRDIKPQNLLVNKQLEVFFCDFGLAATFEDDSKHILELKSKKEIAKYLKK